MLNIICSFSFLLLVVICFCIRLLSFIKFRSYFQKLSLPSVVREVKGQQPFWNGNLGHVHKGISPLTSLNFPLTSLNSLGKIFPQDICLSLRVFVFQVISVKNVHFLCGIRKKYYFCICFLKKRKIGRVTECAGLEIRYTLFRVSGV